MQELQVEYLKIDDITPYENNPRHNDEAVDYVANSINEFGFKIPIVIDENNIIIAGHTRLKASKKLGLEKVPCIRATDLTEEQVKAFRVADNKVGEVATWDLDKLSVELEDIDMDMTDFGFSEIEIGDLELDNSVIVDDTLPEPPKEPKAKRGDVYRLGNHTLMCGDSTSENDVNTLINGGEINLLLTDPPYNVDYEGKTSEALKIQNDAMTQDEFQNFLYNAFKNAYSHMKAGASFYVWYASRETINFMLALEKTNLEVRQQLIWIKNSLVIGRQDYQWKHEPCLYGWKGGASHYFIDDRTQTTVMDFDRPTRNAEHPTMKPIELFAYQIKNSTRKNENVLDLFGGSGTTLIACEQTGRNCYMMEYDPRYVDVIIERWEELTGGKAEKI